MDWGGIFLGGAVGGVAMNFWYAAAWMALPHHKADFKQVDAPGELESALENAKLEKAMYALPHMDAYEQGMKDPALAERMQHGPNAMIVVMPKGSPMSGATLARGMLINLVEGIFGAILLALCLASVHGLSDKVLLMAGAGLFTGTVYLTVSNWMFLPWRFAFMSVFDRVVAFSLLGVVLHFLGPVAAA